MFKTLLVCMLLVCKHVLSERLIFLSLDGFRWDYLDSHELPHFRRLIRSGLRVKNLHNPFSSTTFPNHYTLVTGVYEETHGVVENFMYDPDWNERFSMKAPDGKWFSEGVPVWEILEDNNIKVSCVNYIGCNLGIHGRTPSFSRPYDPSLSLTQRLDLGLQDIDRGASLAIVYFEEPDQTGHRFGPESPEVAAVLQNIDKAVGNLLDRLTGSGISLIVTSDHGMVQVASDNPVVFVEDLVEGTYQVSSLGANAMIWPGADFRLKKARCDVVTCMQKAEIPDELRYKNHRRVAPILCSASSGYVIMSRASGNSFNNKGSHGYSTENENSPMRPIFLASGPSFPSSAELLPSMPAVDVAPLLLEFFGVEDSAKRMQGRVPTWMRSKVRTDKRWGSEQLLINEVIVA